MSGILAVLLELLIAAATALERHWREASGRGTAQVKGSRTADTVPRQGAGDGNSAAERAPRTQGGSAADGDTTQQRGFPAITPRIVSNDPREPAITEQEVLDHFLAHPASGTGKIQTDGPSAVERVEFLPARDVHARLNLTTGRADDAPLCLVTVRGAFTRHGMRGMAPFHGNTVVQVYDARTGNLLLQRLDTR